MNETPLLTISADTLGGEPRLTGTRLPATLIGRRTWEQVAADYPEVSREQYDAAAAWCVSPAGQAWTLAAALDVVASLTAERDEARAEVDELRLALAAEQGRAEGAPSEGWTYHDGYFERWTKGRAVVQNLPPMGWVWRLGRRKFRQAASARAAMLAADAAEGVDRAR